MTRCVVFTDVDLDGTGCLTVFRWLRPDHEIEAVGLKVSNLREQFLAWLSTNKLETFDEVYFFDLDTTDIGDLIDRPDVTVVDHHESHTYEYKHAKAEITVTTSCTKLLYNFLKPQASCELSLEQLKLLSLVDDYDSYTLKFPETLGLNTLFWSGMTDSSHRFEYFWTRFNGGFQGFTPEEQNIINGARRRVKQYFDTLTFYKGEIPIKQKEYLFVSTFVEQYINDVADATLNKFEDCDIVLLISLKNKRVFFRKRKDVDVNLGKLATALCNGGGHEYAAGGDLNENIQALSKNFTHVNND